MLQTDLPEPFQGVYDTHQYRKSQDYLRVNTRFGWVTAVVNLVAILFFWFQGGFPAMDNWVQSFGKGPVLTGLMYIGTLDVSIRAVVTALLDLRNLRHRGTIRVQQDHLENLSTRSAQGAGACYSAGAPLSWRVSWHFLNMPAAMHGCTAGPLSFFTCSWFSILPLPG